MSIKLEPSRVKAQLTSVASRWVAPSWQVREGSSGTVLTVLNTGSVDAKVKVRVRDWDGKLLGALGSDQRCPPQSTLYLPLDDRGANPQLGGSLEVESTEPVVVSGWIDDFVTYGPVDNKGGNGTRHALTVYDATSASAGARRWVTPYFALREGVTDTVVAVMNASPWAAYVHMRVFDERGKVQAHLEAQRFCVPRGQVQFRLDDRGATEVRTGWIEITSTENVFPQGVVTTLLLTGPLGNRGGNMVQSELRFEPRHGGPAYATGKRQPNWRWCSRCQGLHFGEGGVCPAGGAHLVAGSGNYTLVLDSPADPGQTGWRWCRKCQGLFSSPHVLEAGRCPAGGAHDSTGSSCYTVPADMPDQPGQNLWRHCKNCEGMFYGGAIGSVCAAGGQHDATGSGDYRLSGI